MKEKLSSWFQWGTGALSVVMANNLVISAIMLISGICNLLMPERALFWDSLTLSLLLFAYALISIIFLLTNNEKAGGGKDLAGNLIKGYFDKKKDEAATREELFKKDKIAKEFSKQSGERLSSIGKTVADKYQKKASASKKVMLIFYVVLLAISVFLIIRTDIAIMVSHIIIGIVLIVNGVMSIISATAARKQRKFKYYLFSVLLSVISIFIGVVFVLLSLEASILSMQTISILFIVKAVGDFVVAFRNKEIKSSITDTVTQIKQQKKDPKAAENTAQEADETPSETQGNPLGEEESEEDSSCLPEAKPEEIAEKNV